MCSSVDCMTKCINLNGKKFKKAFSLFIYSLVLFLIQEWNKSFSCTLLVKVKWLHIFAFHTQRKPRSEKVLFQLVIKICLYVCRVHFRTCLCVLPVTVRPVNRFRWNLFHGSIHSTSWFHGCRLLQNVIRNFVNAMAAAENQLWRGLRRHLSPVCRCVEWSS